MTGGDGKTTGSCFVEPENVWAYKGSDAVSLTHDLLAYFLIAANRLPTASQSITL
jgi:hypothetical protein